MKWQRKALHDCAPQAWRNGGGITHEIATWPVDTDWRWRVSVARIDRDGPFSAFSGVQRWFAVLEGDGVELIWPHTTLRVGPHDAPHGFPGAPACDARLLNGPTLDFNLMTRGLRGQLQRQQQTGAQTAWPAHAHVGVFACTDCSWTTGHTPEVLKAREFTWTFTPEATSWHWHHGEALVFVLEEEPHA
jgi:environmental stress-induced protein Ves